MEERCRTICYLRDRWRPILSRMGGLVWLSPLHREAWLFAYPELAEARHALVPSPVDPDRFRDLGLVRTGVICVQSLAAFKGADNVIRWAEEHPEQSITAVDSNPEGRTLPGNMTLVGMVPNHELNALYNRHETFLHIPENTMPFDRTVVEGALAGCKLLLNENVGAQSWPWLRQGRTAIVEAMQAAPGQFWDFAEETARRKP